MEFPKLLYRDGDLETGDFVPAMNADEEAAENQRGYFYAFTGPKYDAPADAPKRRGRPPKAEAVEDQAQAPEDSDTEA